VIKLDTNKDLEGLGNLKNLKPKIPVTGRRKIDFNVSERSNAEEKRRE
jgi:hypothetical protein